MDDSASVVNRPLNESGQRQARAGFKIRPVFFMIFGVDGPKTLKFLKEPGQVKVLAIRPLARQLSRKVGLDLRV